MKLLYPDYENGIANLACSILTYYGAEAPNGTLALADQLLKKRYKNVVVLLLDGMGKNIVEAHLEPSGFFRSNLKGIYSSTFPPTTVAATTAIKSGLYPSQSAWLGWDGYFKELDKNVIYFLNTDQQGNVVADYSVAGKYCAYQSIFDRIKDVGVKAVEIMPFAEPYPKTFDALCGEIKRHCELEEETYIYAYWDQPDAIMHRNGCFSDVAKQVTMELEQKTKQLVESLTDTLFIITADHGHIDSKGVSITEYPEIMECLVRMPSIEPRALNLYVKEGKEKQLEEAFQKHFADTFRLMTKQEVMESHIFGQTPNHPRFDEMLGDYLAVGIAQLAIFNSIEEKDKFIGVHAGLGEDEMLIPLIAVEK